MKTYQNAIPALEAMLALRHELIAMDGETENAKGAEFVATWLCGMIADAPMQFAFHRYPVRFDEEREPEPEPRPDTFFTPSRSRRASPRPVGAGKHRKPGIAAKIFKDTLRRPEGATQAELRAELDWSSVNVPANANRLGIRLHKRVEDRDGEQVLVYRDADAMRSENPPIRIVTDAA